MLNFEMSPEIQQFPYTLVSLIGVLGGLVGSILTIAVGKMLDLIQKRQEHRYSLKKSFFEKKLAVAEVVVTTLQKTISVIEPMVALIRKIPQTASGEEFARLFGAQMILLTGHAQKTLQHIDDVSYTASLYFDIDKLNKIGSLVYEKLLNWMLLVDLLNKEMPAESHGQGENEHAELRKKAVYLIDDLAQSLDSLKAGMDQFIKEVRKEMKQFEP